MYSGKWSGRSWRGRLLYLIGQTHHLTVVAGAQQLSDLNDLWATSVAHMKVIQGDQRHNEAELIRLAGA